jgi:hypothetical protein
MIMSSVTPHSASTGRHSVIRLAGGGGVTFAVNPERPSWCTRAVILESTTTGCTMGNFVHTSECSMFLGTEELQSVAITNR